MGIFFFSRTGEININSNTSTEFKFTECQLHSIKDIVTMTEQDIEELFLEIALLFTYTTDPKEIITMARILQSRITLVHPHSRNKPDKKDCLFFLVVFNLQNPGI